MKSLPNSNMFLVILSCFYAVTCHAGTFYKDYTEKKVFTNINDWTSKLTDAEKLSLAISYFQGGKYHEALLLFAKLGSNYKLSPRFQAYLGVCYYYEGEYRKTIDTLERLLPRLAVFSPHEQSVYYYSIAESYYHMEKYIDAVPLYERYTLLCYPNEKGEALFRIGICYERLGETENAQEFLTEAMAYYRKFNGQEKLATLGHEIERLFHR